MNCVDCKDRYDALQSNINEITNDTGNNGANKFSIIRGPSREKSDYLLELIFTYISEIVIIVEIFIVCLQYKFTDRLILLSVCSKFSSQTPFLYGYHEK